MKYKLNSENLLKIINSELVPEVGRFDFEIDNVEITVKKPYIDNDGDEMGNSIFIDNTDGKIISIRLERNIPVVVFRETKKDSFEVLTPGSPSHILELSAHIWCKIVDKFDAFENLKINPSFTFDKVFGIINSSIVPNKRYGWRFEIDDAEITVQKTFIDEEDGQELGDSIHIDNDGELLIYIRVSKPNEKQFLILIYKENDDDEFVELTNESPKRVIYFFNTIWNEIVSTYEERMENILTYDKFSAQFGNLKIPAPLKALFDFENQFTLEQSFTESFYLDNIDKYGLSTWCDKEDFLKNIIEFATANGTGSSYAFWKINDDLNLCPIVVFGDEGGYHVVAENILGLMQLLTYDTEISVDHDTVSFYKDEDDYEESENAETYRNWLKENFNLDPIENPEPIIDKAQEKYKAQFDKWMQQYYTEE